MKITKDIIKAEGGKKARTELGAYKVIKGELDAEIAEEFDLEEGTKGSIFIAKKETESKSGNNTFKKGDYFFIAD